MQGNTGRFPVGRVILIGVMVALITFLLILLKASTPDTTEHDGSSANKTPALWKCIENGKANFTSTPPMTNGRVAPNCKEHSLPTLGRYSHSKITGEKEPKPTGLRAWLCEHLSLFCPKGPSSEPVDTGLTDKKFPARANQHDSIPAKGGKPFIRGTRERTQMPGLA